MPFARRCRPVALAALAAATAATLQAPAAHAAPATEVPVTGGTAGVVATAETGSTTLTTRSGPSTADAAVSAVASGSALAIRCQVFGEFVTGSVRRTAYWSRLSDGSYVSNAFVRWTPSIPRLTWCFGTSPTVATARISAGRLSVRSAPHVTAPTVAGVPDGFRFLVACQAWGTQISGSVRSTPLWYRVATGRYVSAAFVTWSPGSPSLPYCDQAPATVPTTDPGFIARVVAGARAGRVRYGVPASVTIAQAILESGWGRSGLAATDRNYFGIKCFNGRYGTIASGCHVYRTNECTKAGSCFATTASFRTYASMTNSFRDHGNFLTVNSRYKPAFAYTRNANKFIWTVWKAGYATDPNYYTKITGIMAANKLYQYDTWK
jgi:flagellum-specific peptidoglycan hydrolase FlgJ